jgi:hypothetical protein
MIRAFLELPAGLASVSLALQGGLRLRPPISRLGRKTGYADTILDALGLRPGEGAGAYVWAEADADVRGLLRAYPDPAALRAVAAIIRGWAGEDARELWYRLRDQRRARAAEAAATIGETADAVAEFVMISASNRLIPVGGAILENTGQGGTTFGAGGFATPAGTVADRLERVAEWAFLHEGSFSCMGADNSIGRPQGGAGGNWPAIRPVAERLPDAMEQVAEWAFLHYGSYKFNGADNSIGWPDGHAASCHSAGADFLPRTFTAAAHPGWPPVAVLAAIPEPATVAAMLGTPGDLSGCVVYADPPYAGTTGYAHDLPRAEVVRYCLAYAAMGATVCVSEQEAIPDLVAAGWHATEITHDRAGAKRTFSKQQAEWLTMSRTPRRRQIGLFNLGEVPHA